MPSILTYAHLANGRVSRSSLEVMSLCGRLADECGAQLHTMVTTAGSPSEVGEITSSLELHGAEKIYVVGHPLLADNDNQAVIGAIETVSQETAPILIACPNCEVVRDVLGAAAMRLGMAAIPDICSMDVTEGRWRAVRPVQAGRMLASIECRTEHCIVSVRPASSELVRRPKTAAVERIELDIVAPPNRSRRTLDSAVKPSGIDLTEANVVVAAGRGVRDEAGRSLVYELAELMNGAVGATRSAVDTGMFPPDIQIGQTGKVVSPEVYIAVGISGAIQHTAGVAGSRVVIAINKDRNAPIFDVATYGIVGDLYEVLPEMIQRLRAA